MSNNEVDIVAIQQAAEQLVREEYEASYASLRRQERDHELRKAGWDAIMGRIVQHYSGPLTLADNEHLDTFLKRLDEIVALGLDFEVLLKAMKSNEMLQKQWDNICMTMRLNGMDKRTLEPDSE